jgi:hypothetical protein
MENFKLFQEPDKTHVIEKHLVLFSSDIFEHLKYHLIGIIIGHYTLYVNVL